MIWDQPHPEGASYYAVTYSFTRPAQLRIRRPDGKEELMGYGVGEKVKVMEPSFTYSIPPSRMKEEVLLEDGSVIFAWPHDLSVRQERGFSTEPVTEDTWRISAGLKS